MKHNVMLITYDQSWPNGAEEHMAALFDRRDLTKEEACRLIRSGEYSPHLVTMTQEQYKIIFRSLNEQACVVGTNGQ